MSIHRTISLSLILIATSAAAQDRNSPDQGDGHGPQAGGYSARIENMPLSASSTVIAGGPSSLAGVVISGAGPSGFAGAVVTGAPYSAEAVSESIQMLADGNRIRQLNETKLFRDSEGRTRHEQSLNALGPWRVMGGGGRTAFINDPTKQQSIVLDLDQRTARQFAIPAVLPIPLDGSSNYARPTGRTTGTLRSGTISLRSADTPTDVGDYDANAATSIASAAKPGNGVVYMSAPTVALSALEGQSQTTEDLGQRDIEGVSAFGSRTTIVIDANTIGNDLPIEITTERWFSPTLGSLVMSRHSDPRFGEVTYRLINVSLAEPDSALFRVPDDFQIIDGFSGGQ